VSRYWNNHPEELEGLDRDAAVRWMSGEIAKADDSVKIDDELTLAALAETLQAEHPEVFKAMMDAGACRLVDFSGAG